MNSSKYKKQIIIFLALVISFLVGYKSYLFLDFTIGNTLQGVYSSYIYTEKSFNKANELITDVKNNTSTLITKIIKSDQEKQLLKEKIKKESLITKESQLKRNKEIQNMRLLINIIPILLSLIISFKIFSIIINPFIKEDSFLRQLYKWYKV